MGKWVPYPAPFHVQNVDKTSIFCSNDTASWASDPEHSSMEGGKWNPNY
jgi:hypothetical protein